MGIFTPGKSKYAYQGELTCPYSYLTKEGSVDCKGKSFRFIENVSQYRLRYRCRKCGGAFQYDISNRTDLNPYAAYSEGSRFSQHLKKLLGGRTLKGGIK